MPLPSALLEELGEKRAAESREASRDQRRAMARTALLCVVWCVLGLALIGWALHTTDEALGKIAFWGGLTAGNGGMIFTLLSAYRRGEDRGDW